MCYADKAILIFLIVDIITSITQIVISIKIAKENGIKWGKKW